MSKAQGSVCIGPISLFSLIILICLAVLSVLSVSTAQATFASAQKQAYYTEATYANEIAAQEFVAKLDETLIGVALSDSGDPLEAVASALPENAALEGNTVTAQFVSDGGRTLTVAIEIDGSGGYRIVEWRTSTQWNLDESSISLWSGSN